MCQTNTAQYNTCEVKRNEIRMIMYRKLNQWKEWIRTTIVKQNSAWTASQLTLNLKLIQNHYKTNYSHSVTNTHTLKCKQTTLFVPNEQTEMKWDEHIFISI